MAAAINAGLSIATLVVAFGFIGITALANPDVLTRMAVENPSPLLIQDILKILLASANAYLIVMLDRLFRPSASRVVRIATFFGLFSFVLLLTNAALSLRAIAIALESREHVLPASEPRVVLIMLTAAATIFLSGIWFILINRIALRFSLFPKRLAYFGIAIGCISLLPPLGVLALIMNIVWQLGLWRVFWRSSPASNDVDQLHN